MPDPMHSDEGGVQWGVKHSQGVRWESSERAARDSMAAMVTRDSRVQAQARGRVRLVKREIGPLVVVENPYEQARSDAGNA